MSKRTYGQYCALAKALDAVGERWTLLIARELFAGPQRFSDLLQTLPGIGNGLLATRLREMQDNGLIEVAELPPPAASRVYQLTTAGRQLDEAVTALGRWGVSLLAAPEPTLHQHPLWLLQSLAASTRRSPEGISSLNVNVQLDGQRHHLRIRSGRAMAGRWAHPMSHACTSNTTEILFTLTPLQLMLAVGLLNTRMPLRG